MKRINDNKQKKRKLPIHVYLLYVLILFTMISGVTLSKYAVSSSVDDDARVAAMGDLKIEETGNFSGENTWTITPGVYMQKKATVHFGKSEMASYVFLKISTTDFKADAANHHHFDYSAQNTELLAFDVADDWNYLIEDDGAYVYYVAVAPNTKLDKDIIKDDGKITVSADITYSQLKAMPTDFSLGFAAVAVQYNGFGQDLPEDAADARALQAWDSVKNK